MMPPYSYQIYGSERLGTGQKQHKMKKFAVLTLFKIENLHI